VVTDTFMPTTNTRIDCCCFAAIVRMEGSAGVIYIVTDLKLYKGVKSGFFESSISRVGSYSIVKVSDQVFLSGVVLFTIS